MLVVSNLNPLLDTEKKKGAMSIPILVFVLSIKSLVVALGTLAFQKTIGDFASNLSKISALQVEDLPELRDCTSPVFLRNYSRNKSKQAGCMVGSVLLL